MLKHRRIHSGLYWKSKLKRRSFTELTGDAYLASVRFDHLLNDSPTQSQSTFDLREYRGRYPEPSIG